MRKGFLTFAGGFALASLLFVGLGAGPGSEYDRACAGVEGELSYMRAIDKDSPNALALHNASAIRLKYWMRVMEQFKP